MMKQLQNAGDTNLKVGKAHCDDGGSASKTKDLRDAGRGEGY